MKRLTVFLCIVVFLIVNSSMAAAAYIESSPERTATPTVKSSETPFPADPIEAQVRVREMVTDYGYVDEYYLSAVYWEKLIEDVEKYGPARRIVSLEYHGDNYSMYSGSYELSPAKFEVQMRYLMENDYHFVTGPELVGFLNGWLDLPSRSIILTTDSGGVSYDSFQRIVPLFSSLEKEYGVRPHMISFIWTWAMTEGETSNCVNDKCWNMFRGALNSGYFTFGSHTQSHRNFSEMTKEETIADLEEARNKIESNLGIVVYSISWPFENCSPYLEVLESKNYYFAFGGWTRDTKRLYTYQNDNMPLCLPRMFPPNSNGLSNRPYSKTLEQMLSDSKDRYFELYRD